MLLISMNLNDFVFLVVVWIPDFITFNLEFTSIFIMIIIIKFQWKLETFSYQEIRNLFIISSILEST